MEINGFQPDYWENSNGIFHVLRLLWGQLDFLFLVKLKIIVFSFFLLVFARECPKLVVLVLLSP